MRSGSLRGVVAPAASPSPLPAQGGGVLQLQPAVLYSFLAKMCAPIVFADVIAYSNKAELGLTKPPVSQMTFFLWMLKFSKQQEFAFIFFPPGAHTRGITITSNITSMLSSSGWLAVKGLAGGKADSRAVSEQLRVMSRCLMEVMGLSDGHPWIFGLGHTPHPYWR